MKKNTLLLCLLALALTACKPDPEPEPNNGGQDNDTTETVVKKYLVKEYYADLPDEPLKVIEWDDDFTRITHITTYKNNPYQLDYSFEYFGNDSMRVILSKPADSWALVLFTNYTCHFDVEGRICSIDYYFNSEYQSSQSYNYDTGGRLISIIDEQHNVGTRFEWQADNVCATYAIPSGELQNRFDGFTKYFHPECNMPYLLPDGDSYHFWHLTEPLWRNWYTNNSEGVRFEFDEDGYIDYSYYVTIEGDTNSRMRYEYTK